MSHIIITLDGPAGVGKTTLARAVAQALGLPYLNTGAMFRFMALKLDSSLDRLSPEELAHWAEQWHFTLRGIGANTVLLVNGEPLGEEIRSEAASIGASRLAQRPEARDILKKAQRQLAEETSLVAEGRDMGTVVFPHALCKFFLDAAPEARAKRRWLELIARGDKENPDQVLADIIARDKADRTRAVAPLRPAPDAMTVDTTCLTVDQVKDAILRRIMSRCNIKPAATA